MNFHTRGPGYGSVKESWCTDLRPPHFDVAVRSPRGLPAEKRVAELTDGFALSNPAQVGKKRILIVGDVIAYGTTIAQIASLLCAKGAQNVSVAVLTKAARFGEIGPRLRVRSVGNGAGV